MHSMLPPSQSEPILGGKSNPTEKGQRPAELSRENWNQGDGDLG